MEEKHIPPIPNKEEKAVRAEGACCVSGVDEIGRTQRLLELVFWSSEHIVPHC